MAAKQARFGDNQPQTFTDTPLAASPPSEEPTTPPVEEPASDQPDTPPPDPSPQQPPPPDPVHASASEQAAEFFLACMTSVEQQTFLDFCTMRGLTPAAGLLAFTKEKIQRQEMNTVVNNPFTDEAQQVVDSVNSFAPPASPTAHPTQPMQPAQLYQLGRKPTKPCEVCGTPFTVDFLGRLLCSKPECWHAYAGLTPQQPVSLVGRGESDTNRRLGRLESMMERVAAHLDRLVGA